MPTCPTEPQSDLGSVGETVGPNPSYPQEQELAEQTETVSTLREDTIWGNMRSTGLSE
jgi:hypothetical protein